LSDFAFLGVGGLWEDQIMFLYRFSVALASLSFGFLMIGETHGADYTLLMGLYVLMLYEQDSRNGKA
jgi:hypothetical protein